MESKLNQKWQIIRKKGKNKFIWINGVIRWGGGTAVIWTLLMELMSPSDNKLLRLIVALIFFSCGGYFWGVSVWKINEKKHLKSKREKDKSENGDNYV